MAAKGGRSSQRGDSVAQLHQLITDWERRVDAVANRVMGTNEFSRSMNTLHGLQLGMQRAVMKAMATHLKNLNMPSRTDVIELGETLATLEKRMARMEARIASLGDGSPGTGRGPRPGPPRTRQPPSAQAPDPQDPHGGSSA